MNQVQVDVSKTPGFVLCLGHGIGMFPLVVVVPELGSDEDVLALDQALGDRALDSLACLLFVLVVVSSIEAAVASLDRLETCQCTVIPKYLSLQTL